MRDIDEKMDTTILRYVSAEILRVILLDLDAATTNVELGDGKMSMSEFNGLREAFDEIHSDILPAAEEREQNGESLGGEFVYNYQIIHKGE